MLSVKHITWGRIWKYDAAIKCKPSKRKADFDNLFQVQKQKQTKKQASLEKRIA